MQAKKRILSMFLCLSMVFGLLPSMALAAEPDPSISDIPEGLVIEGTTVTDYTGTAADLSIPEGVTEIEGSAFFRDSNLKTITFPSTLSSIGTYAFYGSALTSVTIPAGVNDIGEEAFARCDDLTSVTVQGTVVGEHMFYKSGVQTADLPNVETVGNSAFADCTSLKTLNMPAVEHIGQSAFQSTALTEFTLPETVKSAGASILYGVNVTCLTVSLSTLLSNEIDPSIFANAFYNLSPYENNTRIILTGVEQDVTLLNNGLEAGDKSITFNGGLYQSFLVTDVEATNGTVTNQSGIEMKVNGKPLQTGGAMPADSTSDAYLYQLSLSRNTDSGEVGILLEPEFGNLTTNYAAAVDHAVTTATLTATPSNSSAKVVVTVNGVTVPLASDNTAEISLNTGENIIAIVLTSQNETVEKTYTLTVTRNAPTPENIQISTAQELMAFAADINRGKYEDTSGMTVELTADIDMAGLSWTPIGNEGKYYFEGIFEGNGHTIRDLTLDAQSGTYLGLFGATANTTIRNVHVGGTLHNTTSVTSRTIGGIVGLAQHCEITGCTAEFTVTCDTGATLGMIVGGIVGEADYCHIENCESDTTLSGKAYGYWGGIAGAAVGTELVNCTNRGEFTITETTNYLYAGGIAGAAQNGSVLSQCRNLGAVSLSLTNGGVNCTVGGVCGQLLASMISDCTNYGAVSATANRVGGIAGQVTTSNKNTTPGTVKSCLNYGAVSSNYTGGYAAGIAASVSDSNQRGTEIIACISLGGVSGESTVHAIAGYVSGGVTFQDNYYDSTIQAKGDVPETVTSGSTGLSAAELHSQSFVDTINSKGGNYRLDENNKLEIKPLTYTLSVADSYAEVSGAGEYEAGAEIVIDAGSRPGYRFSGWTATAGTLADPSSAQTTFTMPSEAVTVTAAWTSSGGGSSGSTRYTVSVEDADNGTIKVSPARASKGSTVTITVTPDEGYELDKLVVTDKNGDSVKLTDKGDGKYTFKMPASKVTVEASFVEIGTEPETLPFTDVPTSAYYYDAVTWAVENGITEGTSATTFSPDMVCTRAQMVTFLWRSAGSPAPTTTTNPFVDVQSGAYYYDAVLWAVENGVTEGTSATTFSPDVTCTRAQTVTFLYRANGSPAISGNSPFTDVAEDAYYAAAVQWAVAEGVTAGTSATTFAPAAACTRSQIVTFLYRDMA